MRWTILFLALALPLSAQSAAAPCEAPASTLRLLEALPPVDDPGVPYESRIGALRALATRYPGDFFLQRYYQDAFRQNFYLADEYDRALAMYRSRPDDALSGYFEARLLMMARPQQARSVFDKLLRGDPQFLWPHIDYLEYTVLPGRRDAAEATARWKSFLAGCPAPIDGYFPTELLQDRELLGTIAKDLRQALERRHSRLDWGHLGTIWGVAERAGTPPGELQSQVRDDLRRIASAPLWPSPDLRNVYREAARILADPKVIDGLRERALREAPHSELAFLLGEDDRQDRNPPPKYDAWVGAFEAYEQMHVAALLPQWPDAFPLLQAAWGALKARAWERQPSLGSANDLALIDRWMRAYSASPDGGASWPPVETMVAQFYVTARVRLDQVPRLLDAGLAQIEKQEKYRLSADLYPSGPHRPAADNRKPTQRQTAWIRADYLLATHRPDEARSLVALQLSKLTARNRGDYERREWLRRLGDVDASQGRVQSALANYQDSLAGTRKEWLDHQSANGPTADIKLYYLGHGGTEQQWPSWATAKTPEEQEEQAVAGALQFDAMLPDFSAIDLAGRIWTLRDLQGKATFVNYWATWCTPCRAEHPVIEKLFESLRSQPTAQLLTINVDEDLAVVREYIQDNGYTFPVINARDLADKLLPFSGLPVSFLVDTHGRRTGSYPFSADAASLERLRKDLDRASR